jgi:tRNA wybutosine-synthesizing protein 2
MLVPTAWHEYDDFDLVDALICQQGALGPVEIVLLPELESRASQNVGILHVAVCYWLETLSGHLLQPGEIEALAVQSPVRWSSYPPMLLLPAGSFQTEAWTLFLLGTTAQQRDELWESLLATVSRKDGGPRLTHLAVNSGIPLRQEASETENLFRSPSGLVMLYGDFGPSWESTESSPKPSQEDFDLAFWVSTKQNGIYQTWAPRYTMPAFFLFEVRIMVELGQETIAP